MRGIPWVLQDDLSGKRAPGAAPNTIAAGGVPQNPALCPEVHAAVMSLVLTRRIESKGTLILKWQSYKGTQRLRADFVDDDK